MRNEKFVEIDRAHTQAKVAANEIRRKLNNGEKVTPADLEAIRKAAQFSGRIDDRSTYAQVKAKLRNQDAKMTDEEREATKPTPEQRLAALEKAVEDAYSQAKRTGSVTDRVAYVHAKAELDLERSKSD